MIWTQQAESQLRNLREAGATFVFIGTVLGCTDDAAAGKYKRMTGTYRAPVRAKRSREEPPEPVDDGRPLPINPGVVDLVWASCRWPIGDPQEKGFHFCGKRKDGMRAYCRAHGRLAFVPVSGRL